jgi:hypothetical protein
MTGICGIAPGDGRKGDMMMNIDNQLLSSVNKILREPQRQTPETYWETKVKWRALRPLHVVFAG